MDIQRPTKHPALIAVLALLLAVLSSGALAGQSKASEGVVTDLYGALDVHYQIDDDDGDDPGGCPIVALQPVALAGDDPLTALAANPCNPFLPDLRNRSPPATPL